MNDKKFGQIESPKKRQEKFIYDQKNVGNSRGIFDEKNSRLGKDFDEIKTKHKGSSVSQLLAYSFGPTFQKGKIPDKPSNVPLEKIKQCKAEKLTYGDKNYGKKNCELTRNQIPNLRD